MYAPPQRFPSLVLQGDPRTARCTPPPRRSAPGCACSRTTRGASTASGLPRVGSQALSFGIARASHLRRLGGVSRHLAAGAMATAPSPPPARSSRRYSTVGGREQARGLQTTDDDLEIVALRPPGGLRRATMRGVAGHPALERCMLGLG